MFKLFVFRAIGALVVSGTLCCQSATDNYTYNAAIDPLRVSAETGSYQVARHWIQLKDAKTRLSVFIHLPVQTDSTDWQPVLPNEQWQRQHFAQIRQKVGGPSANRAAKAVFLAGKRGQVAPGKHAVLVFGPGLGWLPTDYYRLILPLVRQGIIVVTVAAVPVSPVVYFPDGQVEQVERTQADYTGMARCLNLAVQQVLALSKESGSVLFNQVDTTRVVVGGHSLSGASALLAASTSKAIRGIINLDGDVTEEMSRVQFSQPILYLTTQPPGQDSVISNWSDDRSERRRDAYFKTNTSAAQGFVRIKVPGMFHSDFLDVSLLKADMDERYRENRFGAISAQTSSALVTQAMLSFIQTHQPQKRVWARFASQFKDISVIVGP